MVADRDEAFERLVGIPAPDALHEHCVIAVREIAIVINDENWGAQSTRVHAFDSVTSGPKVVSSRTKRTKGREEPRGCTLSVPQKRCGSEMVRRSLRSMSQETWCESFVFEPQAKSGAAFFGASQPSLPGDPANL